MSDRIKHPRAAALQVARELCRVLKPVTQRLIVAGSLRRRKEVVGDVEILYIPEIDFVRDGLFDEKEIDRAAEMLKELVDLGTLSMRPGANGQFTWGNLNKYAIHTASGIPVDFFKADEGNWWNYLVCRTGGMENNKRIATAALAKGLKWEPYGSGFRDGDGRLIRVEKEEDIFEILGLPYLEPKDR